MKSVALGGRTRQIEEVLADLRALQKEGVQNEYALKENIKFFEALRSRWAYLRWLISEMPKINGGNLLELSDFLLPRWQAILQQDLLALEKKERPDVIGPLKKELVKRIMNISKEKDAPLVILNVGAGGMEIERQTVERLRKEHSSARVIFIGSDSAEVSLELAEKNISLAKISVVTIKDHRRLDRDELLAHLGNEQFVVICYEGDALSLEDYFSEKSIDIIFYSKLLHHIPDAKKSVFVGSIKRLTGTVLEWDDYNGWYLLLLPALFNWGQPVLLNGAVFSSLRDPRKREIRKASEGWKATIFPVTGYLKIYDEKRK